jgi:hypothetical protein
VLPLLAGGQETGEMITVVAIDTEFLVANDGNRTFTEAEIADLLASVPVLGFCSRPWSCRSPGIRAAIGC